MARTAAAMLGAAALGLAGAGAGAQAGEPVVLELFTSQGCAACPPADAYLAELSQREDVIALALHVDYWNYLGWIDTLASRENTLRQKRHARALKERMIYTPQIVVGGVAGLVGSDRDAVEAAIGAVAADDYPLTVRLRAEGQMLRAVAQGPYGIEAEAVYMVYDAPVDVEIAEGENDGLTMTYVNAVRSIAPLGSWSGPTTEWMLPTPEGAAGVALILQGPTGEVVGAAQWTNDAPSQ